MKMNRELVVLLAGLGNVGSLLSLLLVRIPQVIRVVLLDPDVVEAKNVSAQAYDRDDVGLAKVDAVKAKLVRVRPEVEVVALRARLEDLPRGYFRHVVVLALDGNAARRVAARNAWAMGGFLVDAAVNGGAGLARVTEVDAVSGAGCWECAWGAELSSVPPARHSCATVPPTNAPAALGGLAASVAAMRVLERGRRESPGETAEIVTTGTEAFRTVIPGNPDCPFGHERHELELLRDFDFGQTLGSIFDLVQADSLRLPGFLWNLKSRCVKCAREHPWIRVARGGESGSCAHCGGPLIRLGFHEFDSLERELLSAGDLSRCLEEIGLGPGDVLIPGDSSQALLLGDPLGPPSQPLTPEPGMP